MSKIVYFIIFILPMAAHALSLSEIATSYSSYEGIYTLKSGDIKKCSSGRLMWIEDKEDNSLGLQIGALIIVPNINAGVKVETVEKCTFTNSANFSNDKLDFESSEKCSDSRSFRKLELSFGKAGDVSEVSYRQLTKRKKSGKYNLDHECVLEKK